MRSMVVRSRSNIEFKKRGTGKRFIAQISTKEPTETLQRRDLNGHSQPDCTHDWFYANGGARERSTLTKESGCGMHASSETRRSDRLSTTRKQKTRTGIARSTCGAG